VSKILKKKLYSRDYARYYRKNRILPDRQFVFRQQEYHWRSGLDYRAYKRNFKKENSTASLISDKRLIKYGIQASCSKLKKKTYAYYKTLELNFMETLSCEIQRRNQTLWKTEAGVSQESALVPVLYLIYTSDTPTSDNTTATFADDTPMLATHEDLATVLMKPQAAVNKIDDWAKKWRIYINQSKSTHIAIILRNQTCPAVRICNNAPPPKKPKRNTSHAS
jgi:hypothetical protein